MAFRRANPYIGEIVEELDHHLEKWGGDTDKARQRLSKDDNQWIDDEIVKCMLDRRYFISNYYAIRTEAEGFQGLYPFFDSQEILHEAYEKLEREQGRVRALVLKARQMGSTTFNCACFFHRTIFDEHVNSILVGQDEEQAKYIMGMYESAYEFLPWWMTPRTAKWERGKVINFDERDSGLRAARPGLKSWVYADNANKPSGVGRGKTFGRALLSELAFWQNGSQLSKSLFPTFNTLDGFYVMESTANGRNDFWHNLWRRAEAGKVDWNPIFIPFYRRDKTYSLPIKAGTVFAPTEDEEAMREMVQRKEGYFVRDEVLNWARNKKEEFIATDGDDKMFSQEYASNPEEAFQSSATTAFPVGKLNKLSKQTINPLWIGEIVYDHAIHRPQVHLRTIDPQAHISLPETEDRLHVWEKPQQTEEYIVGADVALGNEGGDYSCAQVIKIGKGHQRDEQVASWHGLMEPESFAEIILALGWWYNEALAAVEVNSIGMVTNNQLVRRFEYENIYRYKRLDRLKNFMTDIIGWWTDEKSKRALISKMAKAFLEDTFTVRDKFLVDELYDFTEWGAEGKGAHDDYVMAIMIALYCAHEGEDGTQNTRKEAVDGAALANVFTIKDRFGTIVHETTSQLEAEMVSRKYLGAVTERKSNNSAPITINGKKVRTPKDFQNSDYSPVHDGDGTARRLYEDGHEAEEITAELIAQYEAEMEESEESPNAWMYE